MTNWHTDDEYLSGPAAMSLPPPHDTPYRTPSQNSKMSRRSTTPPGRGPSPTLLQAERKERNSKRSSKDTSMDETISILDPRRFTPTLHANLVSEILALRRDQEEKTGIIESLEHNLDASREEQRDAEEKFTSTAKENRSLKRQLALLEGGTSTALSELARERDEAVESIGDTKKRLEAAQKKIRSQEEDSERVHDLWSREKEEWEDERRKYERKVHVVESRLKMVLDEVAAVHAAQANGNQNTMNGHESDAESGTGAHNDGGSVRSMSMTNSIRFSFVPGAPGAGKLNWQSLADELHSEGDDDDQTDIDGRESAMSHRTSYRHNRNLSRDSFLGRMHRRNQSLESPRRPGSVVRGRLMKNQAVLEALEGEDEPAVPKAEYVDSGIQYSPPPSPILEPTRPITPQTTQYDDKSSSPIVSPSPPRQKQKQMVSTASQTVEVPLSPPGTPQSRSETPPPVEAPPLILVSAGTQTEEQTLAPPPQSIPPPSPPPPLAPPPLIPSISIMPPTSRPTTPREPRLPPLVKNFGCQVNFSLSDTPTTEVGVQTEGIKVDQRIALLPPHLQPSSISSRPTSPNPAAPPVLELDTGFTPVPPRNPRRLTDRPTTSGAGAGKVGASPPSPAPSTAEPEPREAYPGHNDDGPLSNDASAPIKRPHRFSSLFAGFDTASSDEGEFGEDDLSDSEYRTALSAPRPPSVQSRPISLSPIITAPASPETPKMATARSVMRPISTEVYNTYSLAERDGKGGKSSAGAPPAPVRSHERNGGPSLPGPGNRSSVMRKAAMIQSGIASHNGRTRSPSLTETRNPPFPIPKRESSRNPHTSASAPTSDGQRSPTRFDPWQRRGGGRNAYRSNSIRKVRSAAALPGNRRYRRQGSRSPPPLSPSTEAPESPGLPPLPRNDITTPRTRGRRHSNYRRHRNQPSTNTENTNITANTLNTEPVSQASGASGASGNQTTGVVDAIAQTMVGEWMFKYVRRRKSFNVPESNGKDENGNDRHKRWVWLAPYERAILWSSKQPSSGSALMGKTGRKLTIQSVLDVKDDNPMPKGTTSIFNRSILILTPQRALKFTAMTAERHYIWLTALSFLAHSSQALPDIVAPPPPQPKAQPLPEFEPPRAKGRRPGIRDSIRLAKGRNGGAAAPPSIPSFPSAPSSQMGDGASFRIPETIGTISSSHNRENSQDAAEPPFIPRFNDRGDRVAAVGVHGRKRSNTGGHVPPPLSFRGFSGPVSSVSSHNPTNSTAGASINTAGSSEYYQSQGSGNTGWGMSQTASQRTSEASSQRANFFDAIGTVRMEAFISPLQPSQFNDYPDEHDEIRQLARRRSKEWRRRRSRSRQRDSSSYASRGRRGSDDRYGSSRMTTDDDYFRDDPFRGF